MGKRKREEYPLSAYLLKAQAIKSRAAKYFTLTYCDSFTLGTFQVTLQSGHRFLEMMRV